MQLFKALLALLIVAGIFAAGAAVAGWLWFQTELGEAGPAQVDTEFTVRRGDGVSTIAGRLAEAGVVSDERVFRLHARLTNSQTALKAGTYIIPARASVSAVLDQFVAGDVKQLRLTIPEGLTTAQILRRINDAALLTGDMPSEEIPEGVLLPDTYVFDTGTTRTDFINRMREAQSDLLEDLWDGRQDGLPISTPEEAVILASVVEKETGLAEERPLIAGLFTQRLKRGMRLESDPTIIYGVSGGEPLLNRHGQRRTLYRSEIDRKTDWNTYQIDGLPKTPICNPGRDAIAAVLDPPETKYVFFVADGTGGHFFAETYAQHQRNVAAYRRYEREEIARERSN